MDNTLYDKEWIKESFKTELIFSGRRCILFGTAQLGLRFLELLQLRGVSVEAFVDNDERKWGKVIKGIPVISPNELGGALIPVVITSKYVADIDAQLQTLGMKRRIPHYVLSVVYPEYFPNVLHEFMKDNIRKQKMYIRKAYGLLADEQSRKIFLQLLKFRLTLQPAALPTPQGEQYYPEEFWKLDEHEVFVDVGAYNGDTLRMFLAKTQGRFSKYFAFEPDTYNYQQLQQAIPAKLSSKVMPLNLGVGENHEFVAFTNSGDLSSCVSTAGEQTIEIVTLDEVLSGQRVTTVKMDVEGYEPQVLRGMKGLISTWHPKLAVCVYHRPQHLWELLLMISGFYTSYRYYLRHHESEIYGTVLYCI